MSTQSTSTLSVACFILRTTSPRDEQRSQLILSTWGTECDHLEFIDSNTRNIKVDWKEGNPTLAHKSRRAWMYMHWKYGRSSQRAPDFFVKADLDTYFVSKNFRTYLAQFSPEEKHYIGRQFHFEGVFDFVAGAAIILSRASLKYFAQASTNKFSNCTRENYGPPQYEDVALGKCLLELGILPHNTRDAVGRERFMVFDPIDMYDESFGRKHDFWYPAYSYNPTFNQNCCSPDAVAFHRIHPENWGHKLRYIDGYWVWRKPGLTLG